MTPTASGGGTGTPVASGGLVAGFNSAMANARTNMAASAWAAAELYLLEAESYVAQMPNAGKGEKNLNWQACQKAVQNLRQVMNRKAIQSGGIQRDNIEYGRPTA